MWGHGARDEYTIPSLLSKRFAQEGHTDIYCVNCGESAYTFTQELMYLISLLKQGEIPGYAIFYDGVNDILAAYQNNEPGLIQNLESIRERLHYEKPTDSQMLFEGIKGIVIRKSPLAKLVKKALGHSHRKRMRELAKAQEALRTDEEEVGDSIDDLSEQIILDYKKNAVLLDHLASSYGFSYFLFWQPVVFLTEPVTDEEKGFDQWENKQLFKLYKETYERVRLEKDLKNFYDISGVFNGKTRSLYIDFCHLNEDGHRIIADTMYESLTDSTQ